jgi:hypothetical protein
MKTTSTTAVLAALLLFTACGRKAERSGPTASAAMPIAQPALTAWQQGDASRAITSFAQAQWSISGTLFAPGSTLSLSEEEFQALSNADRQARSGEMMSELGVFKKLAAAVADAGRDAASKGDTAQARKYFTSLKQCGVALDQPGCLRLRIVQLVGQALEKTADSELARLGP